MSKNLYKYRPTGIFAKHNWDGYSIRLYSNPQFKWLFKGYIFLIY